MHNESYSGETKNASWSDVLSQKKGRGGIWILNIGPWNQSFNNYLSIVIQLITKSIYRIPNKRFSFVIPDFKNGKFSGEIIQRESWLSETVRWFFKGFGNFFFWTVWTLDGFGSRGMQWVRINQLSATKLSLQRIVNKSKTSWYFNYGFYWCYRSLHIHHWVDLLDLVLLLVVSTYLKSGTCTMGHVAGILQFAFRIDVRK